MQGLLTPTARLVLFSLKDQPQTLDQLAKSTGTNSISTLREALRSLRIAGKVVKSKDRPTIYARTTTTV